MKRITSVTLISFTISILAICAISLILNEHLPFFDVTFPPKLFLICSLIATLMRGYEALFNFAKLPFSVLVDVIVRLAIVLVMTFWFGPFIGAYEIRNETVFAIALGIAGGTFVLTYAVLFKAMMDEVNALNRHIHRLREARNK